MRYRLWDTDIGRLIGVFETEEEALDLVRSLVARSADGSADDLTLTCERADGSLGESLSGARLIARADAIAAPPERAEARG